jgi:hypothetical protein
VYKSIVAGVVSVLAFYAIGHSTIGLFPAITFPILPLAVHVAATGVLVGALTSRRIGATAPNLASSGALLLISLSLQGIYLQLIIHHVAPVGWLSWGTFYTHDAADFYRAVTQLLWNGEFETPRGRPLSTSISSSLLVLSKFDIRTVVEINLLLVGLSIWSVSLLLWRSLGPIAGAAIFALLFDFMYEHAATITSELIGFVVGSAAFVILWSSVTTQRVSQFLFGIFALSFALVLRVGPLFILPALLIWLLCNPFELKIPRWRAPALALVVIIGVFAMNSAVSGLVTPNSGGSFVNAADSWYAVFANGREALGVTPSQELTVGQRWTQIYRDHPELKSMTGRDLQDRKLKVLFDQARNHPLAGIVGAWQEIKDYFVLQGILVFVENKLARHIYFLLAALGGFSLLLKARRDRLAGFILACNIGIFLSLPFLHGGGEGRLFTSTIVFTSALPAFGLLTFTRVFSSAIRPFDAEHQSSNAHVIGATIAVAGALLLSVFTLSGVFRFDHLERRSEVCAPGEQYLAVHYSSGSSIRVVQDNERVESRLPTIRYSDAKQIVNRWLELKHSMRGIARIFDVSDWSWLIEASDRLKLPLTVLRAPNAVTGSLVTIFVPDHKLSGKARLLAMCGRSEGHYFVARPVAHSSLRK